MKEGCPSNNFDVVKNYGYDDEEIVFNSDDYLECVRVCDEKYSNRLCVYDLYAVYPSDAMLGVAD